MASIEKFRPFPSSMSFQIPEIVVLYPRLTTKIDTTGGFFSTNLHFKERYNITVEN